MERCLEEGILALSESMEDAYLASVVLIFEGLIFDLSMVCEHGRVRGVCHILSHKLELLREDKLSLLECLEYIQS